MNRNQWNPKNFAGSVKDKAGKAKAAVDKKLGRDAASKELADFREKYGEEGTKEEERRVAGLYDRIQKCNYDFVNYPMTMEKFADERSAASQARKMNEEYLNRMTDMCMMPLERGLNIGNAIDTIGIYVGMSMVNPDFRKHCNAKVAASMYPAVEKISMAGATVADWRAKGALKLMTGVEKVTKKEFDVTKKLRDRVPETEKMNEKLRVLHDRMMGAKNGGRVPLTPESAAVTYLGFVKQSYYKMRQPGVDANEVKEQFVKATKTLSSLAQQDGISEEQLGKNVRIIAGQLIERHPEMAAVFEETAYQDIEKAPAREVEIAGGRKYKVWSGEFTNAKTGQPWEGMLTPRIPRRKSEIEDAAVSFMGSVYDGCDTVESVGVVAGTDAYRKIKNHFMTMMNEDSTNPEFTGDDDRRDAEQVMRDVDMKCGEKWAETHQDATADYVNRKEEEARKQRERRVEGLVSFDGPPTMGDDQYGG